ncbi:MAG: cysteine desulfurase family protein, partial [Phycisphaeraceae bacterium]
MPPSMIYLDHNATTPVDRRVLQAMTPFWREVYGNASSRQHAAGRAASEAVENARIQAAHLIGCEPRAIVFTSGATESNNLALKGAAEFYGRDKSHARKRHLIVSAIEHPSVFEVCAWLAEHGFDITTLQPDTGGITAIESVEQAMRDDTLLVSIMWANNETGILNDAARIGALCKSRGVFYHTDATQIVGKLPVNVESTGIDMLSFSAHKMYGPKGAGALYVRRRSPRIRLQAQQLGGGHERELRSGTLN